MAGNPDVISVFESQERQLHTTRSWNFLGIERKEAIPSKSIWNVTRFGEDTIIANFDTGSFYSIIQLFFFFFWSDLVLYFSLTLFL